MHPLAGAEPAWLWGFLQGSIMTLFMLKCFLLHLIMASKLIKINGACTDPENNKLA